jgi:ABC-2 type transport system permease protein
MHEMSRDQWMLGLTLAFAPFFVFLYWMWFQGGSTVYKVVVINEDRGVVLSDGSTFRAGEEVIESINAVEYADGTPLLKVIVAEDQAEAEPLLKDRVATAFLLLPENFSETVQALKNGDRSVTTQITFGGDLSNTYYMIGANLAISAADSYVQQATGQKPLINYAEEAMGVSAARTEFETYVPGTLIFAIILMIFLASMTVAREIETGTLRRLQLTPLTSFELLGGITATLVLVSLVALLLAFGLAVALGFHSQGPLWMAILVGTITSLSVIGVGMIVACFSHTVSQAFVVANFPLGLMMFFSGSIFPLPKTALFTIAGHGVGIYDLLPPTHAVVALNKVLTLGAKPGEIIFELAALTGLSILYFAIGVLLFKRFHLSTAR